MRKDHNVQVTLLIGIAILLPLMLEAQNNSLDGKKAPSQPYVREADIMWMKRVWRRIDLRQKMNHSLYFPERAINDRKSLFDNLISSIQNGEISAYDPGPLGEDDMFSTKIGVEDFEKLIVQMDTVSTTDPFTLQITPKEVESRITSSEIVMYEIKEEWFFDKQRSVMEVRIIGLCPLVRVIDESTGTFRGYKRLFWVYYPEASPYMATWAAFNRSNDQEMRSFEELFRKRMFDSYIVKESNVYNRSIQAYAKGIDALEEAEKIEMQLFVMEHDLWSH